MHPRSQTHLSPSLSSSWVQTPANLGNPFQNTPGQFIYALPNLVSTLPPNAATRPSPTTGPQLASVVRPMGKEEELPLCNAVHPPDLGARSYSRRGEADLHTEQRIGSSTPMPPQMPSGVDASGSSSEEGQSEAEKKPKRTRRKRHRVKPPPPDGLVMGPRAMGLQGMPPPRLTAHPVGSQQPWGPGHHGIAQPYRGQPWPGPPPPPPGYAGLPPL